MQKSKKCLRTALFELKLRFVLPLPVAEYNLPNHKTVIDRLCSIGEQSLLAFPRFFFIVSALYLPEIPYRYLLVAPSD